jgi:hypothetical protein
VASGYTVVTQELDQFASYLRGTTQPAVAKAAQQVHSDNGFDDAAFGIFVGQILAIPARIAMAVVAGHVDKLAGQIASAGQTTTQTAQSYVQNEQTSATSFQNVSKGL